MESSSTNGADRDHGRGSEQAGAVVLRAVGHLRWSRPDLAGALAQHLCDVAVAAPDRDAWLVAAGWRVHAAAAVGDGREVASEVLESLSHWGEDVLHVPSAARLCVELAVLAHEAGESDAVRALLPTSAGAGDLELAADIALARLRCRSDDDVEVGLAAAEQAWARVGGRRAEVGAAVSLLVAAAVERRSGRAEQAVEHAVDGLARLDRGRGSSRELTPSGHLAAALAAEWVSALIDAGRPEHAAEAAGPLRTRLADHRRPTRQLALLRLTITRASASDPHRAPQTDPVEAVEAAAKDAAAADTPDLEHLCRVALGELHESAGRLDAAIESVRLGVVADRRHRARAARFRTALGSSEPLWPVSGADAVVREATAARVATAAREAASRNGARVPAAAEEQASRPAVDRGDGADVPVTANGDAAGSAERTAILRMVRPAPASPHGTNGFATASPGGSGPAAGPGAGASGEVGDPGSGDPQSSDWVAGGPHAGDRGAGDRQADRMAGGPGIGGPGIGDRESGGSGTRERETRDRETRDREAGGRETRDREAGGREAGGREAGGRRNGGPGGGGSGVGGSVAGDPWATGSWTGSPGTGGLSGAIGVRGSDGPTSGARRDAAPDTGEDRADPPAGRHGAASPAVGRTTDDPLGGDALFAVPADASPPAAPDMERARVDPADAPGVAAQPVAQSADTADPDTWLAAALAELDRIWATPAAGPDTSARVTTAAAGAEASEARTSDPGSSAARTPAPHSGASHTNAQSQGAPQTRAEHTSATGEGTAHTSPAHTSPANTGAAQAGPAHTGAAHTGAAQTSASHGSASEDSAPRTSAPQTGEAQTGALQTGALQTGASRRSASGQSAPPPSAPEVTGPRTSVPAVSGVGEAAAGQPAAVARTATAEEALSTQALPVRTASAESVPAAGGPAAGAAAAGAGAAAVGSAAAGSAAGEAGGCVVVLDLYRAGKRLPTEAAAPTVAWVAQRLTDRLPPSSRLRHDGSGSVSVVLPGRDHAAASEWMHRVLPGLVDGLAIDPAAAGALLRAAVHDVHGVVGAQILQRLDRVRPRGTTAAPAQSPAPRHAAPGGPAGGAVPGAPAAPGQPPSPAVDEDTPVELARAERARVGPPQVRSSRPAASPHVTLDADPVPNGRPAASDDTIGAAPLRAGRHDESAVRPPYLPEGVVVRPGSGGRRHRRGPEATEPTEAVPTPEPPSTEGLGLADLLAGALAAYRGI